MNIRIMAYGLMLLSAAAFTQSPDPIAQIAIPKGKKVQLDWVRGQKITVTSVKGQGTVFDVYVTKVDEPNGNFVYFLSVQGIAKGSGELSYIGGQIPEGGKYKIQVYEKISDL